VSSLLTGVALAAMPSAACAGTWVPDSGLPTVQIKMGGGASVAALPSGLVLAALPGAGVFSSDAGSSWEPAGAGPMLTGSPDMVERTAIASAPSDGNIVYLGETEGPNSRLWRSDDAGATWREVTPPFTYPCDYHRPLPPLISISATHPDTLYVASANDGDCPAPTIRRSIDGGMTWTDAGSLIPQTNLFAVDPWSAKEFSIGWAASTDRLLRSTDHGATWSIVNLDRAICGGDPSCDDEARGFVIDPVRPNTMYALTRPGIVRSTDDGASWQNVAPTPISFAFLPLNGLAVDPTGAIVAAIEISADGYVDTKLSGDGGTTWTTHEIRDALFPQIAQDTRNVAVVPDPSGAIDNTTIVVDDDEHDITYVTHDAGQSWTNVPSDRFTNTRATALDASASNPAHLIAALEAAGAAATSGTAWLLAAGLVNADSTLSAYSITSDPAAPGRVYLGTGRGVFISHDDGATYTPTTLDHGAIDALAVDPASEAVYAGAYDGGIWRSLDGGDTWQDISAGLGDTSVNSLAITTRAADKVLLAATTSSGVWQSLDAGAHWSATPLAAQWTNALAVDPTDSSTVYAGGCANDSSTPVVERSDNGGASWQAADGDLGATCLNDLAADAANPGVVYAASGGAGIWTSADQGQSWTPMDNGLSDRTLVDFGLLLDPDGNTLHAATAAGIMRYAFASDAWSGVSFDPSSVPAGGAVDMDVVFVNDGPDDATNVVGTLTLPAGMTAPPTGDGTCSGGATMTCQLGTLAAGDSVEVTFTIAAPTTPGRYTITSSVRQSRPDTDPYDDTDNEPLTVTPAPTPTPTPTPAAPDTTPPDSVQLLAAGLARRFQTSRTLSVSFAGHDNSAGPLSYDLRERTATPHSGFGGYQLIAHTTTSPTANVTLTPGTTTCLSARATDDAGNASSWTSESCTAVPLPAAALHRRGPWTAQHDGHAVFGAAETTTAHGATLTLRGITARRLALIADRCSACGSVTVSFAGRRIATINLASRPATPAALIQLAPFSAPRHGTLTITATSSRRHIRIDAVGVSAT
jgi:uncharacterized repeat protein (TIGR01451 family)